MPRQITQYRVFIGSPGGLEAERKAFEKRLDVCSKSHGAKRNVHFEPIGWEDTLAGVGRPQKLINSDLEGCDYAVFVFHDRWGSPSGRGGRVGTEEEWRLAERLYDAGKIRNIVLFFKAIDSGKTVALDDQTKAVLAFRKKIETGKRHLFRDFTALDEFCDHLDHQLAQWLDDHERKSSITLDGGLTPSGVKAPVEPNFAFWLAEATTQTNAPAVCLHFAEKALALAETDLEWADARSAWGVAKYNLGHVDEAIAAFREISARFSMSRGEAQRLRCARALFNTGATLGTLDRSEDAIAVYDDVIARFADAREPAISEWVAKALFNKGVRLGALGRNEETIATYDDVVTQFATASEPKIREPVAKALFNKGVTLAELGRNGDAIAVYDDVVARFATAHEPAIREQVAKALFNKGVSVRTLGRNGDAIAVYDDIVARFATAREPAIREQIAKALVDKGETLGALGRSEDEIAVYDDVVARFAAASEPAIRELVAEALIYKGVTLEELGRSRDAIAVYDDLLARFGREPSLAEVIDLAKAARARAEKAATRKN